MASAESKEKLMLELEFEQKFLPPIKEIKWLAQALDRHADAIQKEWLEKYGDLTKQFDELQKSREEIEENASALNALKEIAVENAKKEVREEVMKMCEEMKGLANNPDFFITLKYKLKNNVACKGIDEQTITQVVWEAKDQALSAIQEWLKTQ